MTLVTRTSRGSALIDGRVVCEQVTLTEATDQRLLRVPGASGYKDVSVERPSELTFDGELDPQLRSRLEAIVAVHAAHDVQAARRLRDRGESAVAIDLELDDGRHLERCSVSAPLNPFGALQTLRFSIHHRTGRSTSAS